jgi:hypothetical protein
LSIAIATVYATSQSPMFDESKTQSLDERQSILPGPEETCKSLITYKSAAPQIHRLPLELLMGTFSLCLLDERFISPLPTCAPLLLTKTLPRANMQILYYRCLRCGVPFVSMSAIGVNTALPTQEH